MRIKVFFLILSFLVPISLLSQPSNKRQYLPVSSSSSNSCWEPGDLPSQKRYCLGNDLNKISTSFFLE